MPFIDVNMPWFCCARYRTRLPSVRAFSPLFFSPHTLLRHQGVPVRIEIGPKDVANKQAVLVRRDTGEKYTVPLGDIAVAVPNLLDTIQRDMLAKARRTRDERMSVITEYVHSRHAFVLVTFYKGAPYCM